MAYVPSTAGAKKGIKLTLRLPDDTVSTRSYSGLNYSESGGNNATGGSTPDHTIEFFQDLITGVTTAVMTQQYTTTEQQYEYQE